MRVVLEVAPKKAFASALEWPGWARSGRTPDEAIEALITYGPRYAAVAKRARVAFSAPKTPRGIEIVGRLDGGGGTEFGVPGEAAEGEEEPLTAAELKRLIALLRASWARLEAVAQKTAGVELAKGPRGGGRNLHKILDHVREAERSYTAQLGGSAPDGSDPASVRAAQDALIDAVHARNRGDLPDRGPRGGARWSPRYAIRRAAWHVLDHAWEIEDRSP